MWRSLQESNIEELSDISSDMKCTICSRILINAHRSTTCGCRYCLGCMQAYLSGERRFCPGNMDDCQREVLEIGRNIHPDVAMNYRISKLSVRCRYSCGFRCELSSMDEHEGACGRQPASCQYVNAGCTETQLGSDRINEEHLLPGEGEGESRAAQSMMACIERLQSEIQSIRGEIDEERVRQTRERIDQLLARHTRERIDQIEQERARQTSERIDQIEQERARQTRERIDQIEQGLARQTSERIDQVEQELARQTRERIDHIDQERARQTSERIDQVEQELANLRNESRLAAQENRTPRAEMEPHGAPLSGVIILIICGCALVATAARIEMLARDIEQLAEQWRGAQERLGKVERQARHKQQANGQDKPESRGEFEWRVDGWAAKSQSARKSGDHEEIFSGAFFSHENGYRMCLSMWPNGRGVTRGTQLAVYFHLLPGPFDNGLAWPFKRAVTLSLINQRTGGDHVSRTFTWDQFPGGGYWDRPAADRNAGFGTSGLVELAALSGWAGLLWDDSILIRCTVVI